MLQQLDARPDFPGVMRMITATVAVDRRLSLGQILGLWVNIFPSRFFGSVYAWLLGIYFALEAQCGCYVARRYFGSSFLLKFCFFFINITSFILVVSTMSAHATKLFKYALIYRSQHAAPRHILTKQYYSS
jgi:hypothetical protein